MKNNDIYQKLADQILSLMDKGIAPWRQTWNGTGYFPVNGFSKKPYHGVNLYLMWLGFKSNEFFTFKQITELGGKVKKGEKGAIVLFWKFFVPKAEKAAWDALSEEEKARTKLLQKPILQYYTVFNREQCEGLPEKEVIQTEFNPIEEAEKILVGYKDKPEIIYGGGSAFYSPTDDRITVPNKEDFFSPEEFYATLFHESVHSTGHEKRLKREIKNFFGDDKYSFEELVAEFGASFLCGKSGISQKTVENSAAYIKGWGEKIRKNTKALFDAISKAGKAADYILNQKGAETAE